MSAWVIRAMFAAKRAARAELSEPSTPTRIFFTVRLLVFGCRTTLACSRAVLSMSARSAMRSGKLGELDDGLAVCRRLRVVRCAVSVTVRQADTCVVSGDFAHIDIHVDRRRKGSTCNREKSQDNSEI